MRAVDQGPAHSAGCSNHDRNLAMTPRCRTFGRPGKTAWGNAAAVSAGVALSSLELSTGECSNAAAVSSVVADDSTLLGEDRAWEAIHVRGSCR
jgi:hypothetical protein